MSEHEPWKAPIVCAEEGCNTSIPSHAWSVIKTTGWFHQHNGDSWCPEHIPEWVEEWRAKKKRYKNG